MMDYWISFATSLTPNDGKGVPRTYSVLHFNLLVSRNFILGPDWPEFTSDNQVRSIHRLNLTFIFLTYSSQVLLQLNGENTMTIPDDYREEQIVFINSNPPVFQH